MYLSGGIDSALTGIYLRKKGVKVNGYTLAPWGIKGSEVLYATTNAKVIDVNQHEIIPFEYKMLDRYYENYYKYYHSLNGTSSSIGVAALWEESGIDSEAQIFGAQNTDTMTCSVPAQYYIFFSSFLPRVIRKNFNIFLHGSVRKSYLSFLSKGQISENEFICSVYPYFDNNSKIFQLSVLGMLIGHSPSDGESLSAPVINTGKIFSNINYDMDLIEFALRLPWQERINFSKKSKTFFVFDKKCFKKLALKYLPKELVERKKGFTMQPKYFDNIIISDNFLDKYNLSPREITSESKFAYLILKNFCIINNLVFP